MTTMRALGHDVGDARFQTHWDTFITEEDIANIGDTKKNKKNGHQKLNGPSVKFK